MLITLPNIPEMLVFIRGAGNVENFICLSVSGVFAKKKQKFTIGLTMFCSLMVWTRRFGWRVFRAALVDRVNFQWPRTDITNRKKLAILPLSPSVSIF